METMSYIERPRRLARRAAIAGLAAAAVSKNAWNQVLDREAELARQVVRAPKSSRPWSTTGGPTPIGESDYQNAVINTATAGDNVIIPGTQGAVIEIYQLFLWNVTQQNLQLCDGPDLLAGPLANFPGQSGVFLPFVGEPHFILGAGNSFVLNLSAAAQVSGWVKYRIVG